MSIQHPPGQDIGNPINQAFVTLKKGDGIYRTFTGKSRGVPGWVFPAGTVINAVVSDGAEPNPEIETYPVLISGSSAFMGIPPSAFRSASRCGCHCP